jgi:hypothetical protein
MIWLSCIGCNFFLVAQSSQLASWIHRHDIEVTNIGENQPSPESQQSVNGSSLLHTDPLWSNSLGLFWAITIIPWATQWCRRGAGLHEASGPYTRRVIFLGRYLAKALLRPSTLINVSIFRLKQYHVGFVMIWRRIERWKRERGCCFAKQPSYGLKFGTMR